MQGLFRPASISATKFGSLWRNCGVTIALILSYFMNRRTFLQGALATGALALSGVDTLVYAARPTKLIGLAKPTQSEQELADTILAYAKSLGAAYCDVRIIRYLQQS